MSGSQANAVQTLRWCSGHLEMIDQRVLPAEFRYVRYDSAEAVAQGIRDMVVRGAPAIGCAAAYGVALEALRQRDASSSEFAGLMERAFTVLAASWRACACAGKRSPRSLCQRRLGVCWTKLMKSSPKTSG